MKTFILFVGLLGFSGMEYSFFKLSYNRGYDDGVKKILLGGIMMHNINMSHMSISYSEKGDTTFYNFGDFGKIVSRNGLTTEVFTK